MAHIAEKTKELTYSEYNINSLCDLNLDEIFKIDIIFISFPRARDYHCGFKKYVAFIDFIKSYINNQCKIIIYADNETLSLLTFSIQNEKMLNYKNWISIRTNIGNSTGSLLNETKGTVIFSKDKSSLKITKVRLPYTYCPACNKTTKDYGGKKHLYNEYGTLISDVWKDLTVDNNIPLPKEVIVRLKDMFSIEPYSTMVSLSLWGFDWEAYSEKSIILPTSSSGKALDVKTLGINENQVILGDALKELNKINSNTVDYIFVDPPYNLNKQYTGYHDNLELEEYLLWCDRWLYECYRILKPGKYLSILNLPLWCCRHYALLASKMEFSAWITWEGLSRPARNIMPANYTVLTLRKNSDISREHQANMNIPEEFLTSEDYYCLRTSCVKKRQKKYKPITDLWTDIHRLVHNSKRYNHPCQLPPKLVGRLISIYTKPNDIVLDCFNGIGTTTICAQWLNRRYIGIELNEDYHTIAKERHESLVRGGNLLPPPYIPSSLKVKNNSEKRTSSPNRKDTGFTKKEVQLMLRDLSQKLNKIPTLDEALQYLSVPQEFYKMYFKNWGEVVAAAKTTGMREYRVDNK